MMMKTILNTNQSSILAQQAAFAVLSARRRLFDEITPPKAKRSFIQYDRERARAAVEQDYWGPSPIFNDKQFERFFRISKPVAQFILEECCKVNDFFKDSYDATKRRSICVKVKLMMGLKCLAFGVSPTCFQDYFQMGETTGILCVKNLCSVLCHAGDIRQNYLRAMNRADAKRVVELHNIQHGVNGLIGSLDCMHIG
jgi:hypothetical protein